MRSPYSNLVHYLARRTKKSLSHAARIGALIVFAALAVAALAVPPFHKLSLDRLPTSTPSASASKKASAINTKGSGLNAQLFKQEREDSLSLSTAGWLAPLPPPPADPIVSFFAADCTTPKTVFSPGDTVCARIDGLNTGLFSTHFDWSNPDGEVKASSTNITADGQTRSFTLDTSASVGGWNANIIDQGGTPRAIGEFTVSDAANPAVDLSLNKDGPAKATAGNNLTYTVVLFNYGPDAAQNVVLTDDIPANTTFVSIVQNTGPIFTCTGNSTTTTCTIPSMAANTFAIFAITYNVASATPDATVITNTASVTNTVTDRNTDDNSASAETVIAAAACTLNCPDNITVQADPGQAGAFVTYSAPTSTGDCGPDPPSCSQESGSFFSVGTTPVTCVGNSGNACTFTVTVENPGSLSISLNGQNPMPAECGDAFNDPGATAVNGSGQSVPVTVNGNVDLTTAGSYTLTYTATEGANSVSTTRTVNVVDTTAPIITIEGANPYQIQTGSCLPFVDPGVSANDGCAGTVPVTFTISGPGGLTSVDNNTPGTYTVTYSATDGSHPATATRTVLVGNFPPDDLDQPPATTPPTITLNGNAQVTVECGSSFTDPGATATACGSSVPVTTSGTVDTHTPGVYTITYTATNSGGTAETHRTVTVEDTTAPVITLNGANPLQVECHSSFTDPGATANDACAGSVPVTTSGSVDPNTPGTYTITYSATDGSHPPTVVTRTVNVVDTTPPTISCQADILVSFDPAISGAVVTYSTPVGADACSGALTATQTTGLASGATFPLGVTTNTFTVTDGAGRTASCSFKVTVALISIIGLDSVSISGAGPVDSYDSNGGYPATKGSLANVLSNGTITMSGSAKVWGNVRSTRAGVAMSGASQVTGNATAGTTVTKTGSATVGGTTTNNALAPVIVLPAVSTCGPPYSSGSGISGTYSYNASTGNLSLTGVNVATLANGTYCFNNVSVGSSAQLKVNGPVTIKLTGTLSTSGAASINNTTLIPGNLRILSSYTGSNGVTFGNSASAYLLVYAPQTGVTISGAAPLFGTVAGKSLTISNSGMLHYDTRLQTVWPIIWPLIGP